MLISPAVIEVPKFKVIVWHLQAYKQSFDIGIRKAYLNIQ